MSDITANVQRGANVVASDGDKIGEVKEVRSDHLVVERGFLGGDDLYVPIDVLAGTDSDEVRLELPADEVGQQGWQVPQGASYEHVKPAAPEVPRTTTMEAAGMSAGMLSAPEAQGFVRDIDADDDEAMANRTFDSDAPEAIDDER